MARAVVPILRVRARTLRRDETDAEAIVWWHVRNRQLNGFKFRRQVPIGPYIADFVCQERRIIVELDGSQHADSGYDRRRDQFMVEHGWSVLRFWNVDALKALDAVVDTILAALDRRLDAVVAPDLRFTPSANYREILD